MRCPVPLAALALFATSLVLVGCGGTPEQAAWDGLSAARRHEAQELFAQRCATCHGERSDGRGPSAAGLVPPPTAFDAAWRQAAKRDQVEAVIRAGGAALGQSPAMPPHPDLDRAQIEALALLLLGR